MLVTDTVTLGEPRMTRDGYMVVDAKIARTGIQTYAGDEMGRADLAEVRVLRPEDEVFDEQALASFTHRTVTNDHPTEMVSAENWREHSVGMTGDIVMREGHFVRVPFTLMDAATITAVQGGKRELSAGYLCEIDWTAGVTPDGEPYDAIQRNIRGNHLAVVQRGRAGSACRIGDSWNNAPSREKERPGMPDNLRTIMVDGITISATDQSAQAIERLQGHLRDAAAAQAGKDSALAAATTDHARAISAKDGVIDALKASHTAAISAKDGEIDALKTKIPDATALDGLIVERERVVTAARKILGDAFDAQGKSANDIRRLAVVKHIGDAVKDRDDAYMEAAFDGVTARLPVATRADPLRRVITTTDARPSEANDGASAHAEMIARMTGAWQTPTAQGAR